MNDTAAKKTPEILVVDDDDGQRLLLEAFLKTQGFVIITAHDAAEGLRLLEREPVRMVISDVRMPGMTGLEMLHELRARNHTLPVLLVTAFPEVRDAVLAMRDGAVNYLQKPIDLDELLSSVRHALGLGDPLKQAAEQPLALPPNVVAQSAQMREVIREASFVAPTNSRILITGESGVGKEVIADLVHNGSPRAGGKLVKVNCAAIPETLLESELFGHERGSFTGATQQRFGCFEQAQGGTILLDEIGEMPLALQAKLLRVTQDGSFRRVGGQKDLKADARMLATTNRNLEEEVKAGRFREDLFFRLNVFEIYIPPLRERKPDIVPLANAFAEQFTGEKARFSASALTCIELYPWPGNVRELRNAMERAALMARGSMILQEHLPGRVQQALGGGSGAHTPLEGEGEQTRIADVERTLILQTLANNNYNRSETARILGISRRTLLYKLQRLRELGYATDSPVE